LGTGWELPAGKWKLRFARETLFKYSVEKHYGLEIVAPVPVSLRAGYDGRGMSYGIGVIWNRYRVDYTFRDDPLGAMNRMNFAYLF